MRVLYHHRTLADGAEGIHIAEMVKAFRDLGHDVRVLGAEPGGPGPGRTAAARVKAALPRVAFELAAAALNAVDYAKTGRALRAFRPHLVYKRHARYDIGAALAARRAGVPVVLEVNCVFSAPGYERFEPHALPGLARRIERRALRVASVVVAVSTPLAREVQALAGIEARVVPNGVDVERFDPEKMSGSAVRARLGLDSRFIVGWTGVLRHWHGLEVLLEAVAPLKDTTLLLVGDGPARGAVEARAQALGMADRVVVTGRVEHASMPDYLAAMDVAAVADERTGVASPMKLVEYMAMGRAVVAPALDNIRDVVEDGVDGVLFEAGRAEALSRAIAALERDVGWRVRLGEAARRRILAERSWERVAGTVLAAVAAAPFGGMDSTW